MKIVRILVFCVLLIAIILGIVLCAANVKALNLLADCRHGSWENGICTFCGADCVHVKWLNGICDDCGQPCVHRWEDSACQSCGILCEHDYENSECVVCGAACEEHLWLNGRCELCGYSCVHDWSGGECLSCKIVCPHEAHSPSDQGCLICGEKQLHRYAAGVCSCGAEPHLYDDFLPDEYYQPCARQGEIQELSFESTSYLHGASATTTRAFDVYLPYGYTEEREYNVLILIHGGGDDQKAWTSRTFDYIPDRSITLRNIYDNMIDQKLCEPLIIVSLSTNTQAEALFMDESVEQIAHELRATLMPYLVEHYSTYAGDSSIEAISAAREHFGIGGLSNGSNFAYNSGMLHNFDLFANYVCLSGNNNADGIEHSLNGEAWGELPLSYLYAGAGTDDGQQGLSEVGFWKIADSTERIQPGVNAMYMDVSGGHEWKVWSTHIFNALQVLFP